ncbi:hypothetical protein J3A83DRAFT_2979913 [Scleroderma citrinum]
MATSHRQLVRALVNTTPNGVGPSARRSAASLPPVELAGHESAGHSLPRIFDVFDAPVMLGESSKQLGRLQTGIFTALASTVAKSNRQKRSQGNYSEVLESHTTLPPPIIFDGPACPPHLSPSILERHRQLRRRASSVPAEKFSSTVFWSEPEMICEIFDGPSRITRYQYHMMPGDRSSYPFMGLTLCLSTFCWLVFQEYLSFQ